MKRNFKINEDTITDLHKLNGAQSKELETHYMLIEKLQNVIYIYIYIYINKINN